MKSIINKEARHAELVELKAAASPGLLHQLFPGLKKSGSSFVAHCCFHHPDRNPSLRIDRKHHGFSAYCDSCGGGGDIITLIEAVHGCNFDEAVAILKGAVGSSDLSQAAPPPPAEPIKLPFDSAKFARKLLSYQKALNESIEAFADPFAADGSDKAATFLITRSVDFAVARELGFGYAAWCDGLAMPSYSDGELIGIKFRAVGSDQKWNAHAGSESDILYGAHLEPADIFSDAVLVFESQLDMAMVRSLGFNAVALHSKRVPSTDRFLADVAHVKTTYNRVILVGDPDNAGREAMNGLLSLFGHCAVLRPLPNEGQDIGEFYKADPEAVKTWLVNAVAEPFSSPAQVIDVTSVPTTGLSNEATTRLHAPSLDQIEEETIGWLWKGYVPEKLTILAGAPGTGKSTLAYTLGAIVSVGGLWPDGTMAARGRVLIWSSEDTAADIVKPRLKAAGADLSRVHFLDSVIQVDGTRKPFDPAKDVPEIRKYVERYTDVKLIVIDPIVSAISGDMHKANDVRTGLQPVIDFAGDFGVSVLCITHFAKGTSGKDTTERVIGSQAFAAAARMVLVTARDPKTGDCVITRSKSNIGPSTGGFQYTLPVHRYTAKSGATIETIKLEWGDAVEGSAAEVIATVESVNGSEMSAHDRAVAFVSEVFERNPEIEKDKILALGKERKIGGNAIYKAAGALGVDKSRTGYQGKAIWTLIGASRSSQTTIQ